MRKDKMVENIFRDLNLKHNQSVGLKRFKTSYVNSIFVRIKFFFLCGHFYKEVRLALMILASSLNKNLP